MKRLAVRAVAITASVAALGLAPGASAATKGGVTMPDTMTVDGTTLLLNGIGVRSFTVFHVRGYVAGLYLPRRTTEADTALAEPGPKALVMQFTRAAGKPQAHDLYVESSRKYCASHACTEADKAAFEALLGTVRAIRPGDRTGFIVTGSGVRVLFNDAEVTRIADPAFGRVILDSDLGTTSPSAELRDGLLGRDDG